MKKNVTIPAIRTAPHVNEVMIDFVLQLLRMQRRTEDRDLSTAWMPYENFAEYYACNKWLFIVAYSDATILTARIVRLFVMQQIRHTWQKKNVDIYELLKEKIDDAIAENFNSVETLMKRLYISELEDIARRNANPAFI